MHWKLRVTRNSILFAGGLIGVAHQTFVEHVDRPALLVVFAAMLGLPAFLGGDEKREKDAAKKDTPAPKPEKPSSVEVEE